MNILLALFFALSAPEIEDALLPGDTVYVDQAPIDFITQQPTMEVKGIIKTAETQIDVDVNRTESGLTDQLCIGSCVNGNGETAQQFSFRVNPEQQYDWYAHFIPTSSGEYPITYTFKAGEDRFELKSDGLLPVPVPREDLHFLFQNVRMLQLLYIKVSEDQTVL